MDLKKQNLSKNQLFLMRQLIFTLIIFTLFIWGCIKDDFIDDFVEPTLRIDTLVDTLAIDSFFQFEAIYLNNVGVAAEVPIEWSSSLPEIISITSDGLAQALQFGSSIISVQHSDGTTILKDSIKVSVGGITTMTMEERGGTIASTSSYTLTGDFILFEEGNSLILELSDNYQASTALPGLYVYLTNNRNTTANALEIGAVQIFSGAHSYTIENTGINDYNYILYFCKPFNVKVGDGEIF